jgi:hypothetical protein
MLQDRYNLAQVCSGVQWLSFTLSGGCEFKLLVCLLTVTVIPLSSGELLLYVSNLLLLAIPCLFLCFCRIHLGWHLVAAPLLV